MSDFLKYKQSQEQAQDQQPEPEPEPEPSPEPRLQPSPIESLNQNIKALEEENRVLRVKVQNQQREISKLKQRANVGKR